MKNLNIVAPFLWMGFKSLKATELLQGDSLLSTSKCSVGSGTHLINFDEMKGWNSLDLQSHLGDLNPGPYIENPAP